MSRFTDTFQKYRALYANMEAQDVFQEALLIFYRKSKTPDFKLIAHIKFKREIESVVFQCTKVSDKLADITSVNGFIQFSVPFKAIEQSPIFLVVMKICLKKIKKMF